jgi:acetyl/propionyl-CoA carboxylase alpha subunit
MAVVRSPEGLDDAIESAKRIARSAFDDDRLILERYIARPRHVEVQVLADSHGSVVHLGERDCSVQRRHQKVLEETPAPNLDPSIRSRLCESAVSFAAAATYVGAGTCEFLLASSGEFGFIEMNARLQVEHPVTEAVTGLDLVELQLRVAMSETLPLAQDEISSSGHAVEVRVYAEDPHEGAFLPQAGSIEHVRWPEAARVDAGIEEGTTVTTNYDPLLAKIVVHASDREAALQSLSNALDETEILGPRTNLSFLRDVVDDQVVRRGDATTDWLEGAYGSWRRPVLKADVAEPVIALAAAAEVARAQTRPSRDPWQTIGPWRGMQRVETFVVLRHGGQELAVRVASRPAPGSGRYEVGKAEIQRTGDCHGWTVGDERLAAARTEDAWLIWHSDQFEIGVGPAPRKPTAAQNRLESPLPGQVIAVHVEPGQRVAEGDEIVVVEAMKMEHAIKAPTAGTIRAVLCTSGDQVERGQALVDFAPDTAT